MKIAAPSLVLCLLIPALVFAVSSAGTPRTLSDSHRAVSIAQVAGAGAGTEKPIYGPNNITTHDSPLLIALIWTGALGSLGTIIALFIRFTSRHNEHAEFDDHLPEETRARGLRTFMQLAAKDKEEQEEESGHT